MLVSISGGYIFGHAINQEGNVGGDAGFCGKELDPFGPYETFIGSR